MLMSVEFWERYNLRGVSCYQREIKPPKSPIYRSEMLLQN